MQSAKAGTITFMVSPKYREQLAQCQASAVVLTQDDLPFATVSALVVKNPYLTYARMAQILDTTPQPAQPIRSTGPAQIAPTPAPKPADKVYDRNGRIVPGVRPAGPNRVFDSRTGRYYDSVPAGDGQQIKR